MLSLPRREAERSINNIGRASPWLWRIIRIGGASVLSLPGNKDVRFLEEDFGGTTIGGAVRPFLLSGSAFFHALTVGCACLCSWNIKRQMCLLCERLRHWQQRISEQGKLV